METNFDEGISDEVLKGSFLALKQLQTKGKKVGKLKKSPSTVKKEVGPRSQLYEQFKELQGFSKSFDSLETKVPMSLLMYQTFKEIFAEKEKKIRYTDSTKPDHPFFGKNAVLAEDFKLVEMKGLSNDYQETIESMEVEGLIKKYNYNMLPGGDRVHIGKVRTHVIKPLMKRNLDTAGEAETYGMPRELLENIQRVLVDSEDEY